MIPNAVITLYNRYILSREEKYQRSELSGVVWQSQKAVSRRKEQVPANTALVMIPFVVGNQYVTPKNFTAGQGTWTLQEGDIIVRGIATESLSASFTVADLQAKYDDVVLITSVDAMDQGSISSRHWEVGCK